MGRGNRFEQLGYYLHSSLGNCLSRGVHFEHCQGRRSTRIGYHLRKLREEHDYQGMDLILIASDLLAQLGTQADHFSVGSNLLARNVAHALFSDFRKRRAMVMASSRSVLAEPPLLQVKVMRLPRM
jgi:hypothetical protein